MAFAASMVWEVRTTGSDSNGGGFDPTSGTPGTDYSQQDSPQVSYTDLVIDGTTNTKCTSSAHPFTSAHVGNVISITGGTGFTVQRVQIMSVTGSTATVDKSLGTLSSTGGTGNLGGACLTIATPFNVMQPNNTLWVKSGTYTITSGFVCPSITTMAFFLYGYGSTRGDGTRATVTTSTNSINMWDWPGGISLAWYEFHNFNFTNTAATPGHCFYTTPHVPFLLVRNCKVDGFNVGFNASGAGAPFDFTSLIVEKCEISNCTSHGIINSSQSVITNCFIHDNGGVGFEYTPTQQSSMQFVSNCIFYKNDIGVKNLGQTRYYIIILNCTFHTNTGAAITSSNQHVLHAENCIFYANTTYAFDVAGSTVNQILLQTNAFGGQGTANYNVKDARGVTITSTPSDITLTGDPCTNPSGGDFSLNNTAGAGAACRAAGTQF